MRTLVMLCAAVPALAQFAELATSPDGSQLYFTTTLRERGSTQTTDPKLYLFDNSPALLRTQTCNINLMTGACGITDLQVVRDAVVYQSRFPCQGGSSCFFRETAISTLLRQGAATTYQGRIRLSRNGRFMVHHDMNGAPGTFGKFVKLHDIHGGTVADLDLSAKTVVAVTDTGTVLSSQGMLVTPTGRTQAPLAPGTLATDMDAAGRHILTQGTYSRPRLYIADVAAGRYWQLGPDDRDSYRGSLSADGQWVLYTSVIGETPQLFFSRTDGTDWRQLTSSDDGVLDAALSNDGRTAYIVNGRNAVLRLDTLTGQAEEVLSPAPHILEQIGATVPGSLNVLTGRGFKDAQVTIADSPVPLLSQTDTSLAYQIPWDAPDASIVVTSPNPYFEAVVSPRRSPDAHAVVHQDFSSIVNTDRPAEAGEIVHIYATGFGPVAPSGDLFYVTAPWTFVWSDGSLADVLFLGLAPGMIGIYQLDVRVPALRYADLRVTANGGWYAFAYFPIR